MAFRQCVGHTAKKMLDIWGAMPHNVETLKEKDMITKKIYEVKKMPDRGLKNEYWILKQRMEIIRTVCPVIMICLQILLIIKLY